MPGKKRLTDPRREASVLEARAGIIPASDAIEDEYRIRMERLDRVVSAFAKARGCVSARGHLAITDILSDLRHYCDRYEFAFEELDAAAEQLYLEEANEFLSVRRAF